ncbi:MAG TPA: hypothetical protein VKR52_12850 [Terracidiphilus sp.]|nr:hypothetical protein [Terracidiphilus sp.]
MRFQPLSVAKLLDRLEAIYGPQQPCWPVDPYEFLIWWYCGYPASDVACSRGWNALASQVGVAPQKILAASQARLAAALKGSGMFPETRAMRLQEVARCVQDEYGGDLRAALVGRLNEVRKKLKRFHSIGDPGADRILLFGHLAALAAVPSNCAHVLVRIESGREGKDYRATYRTAQTLIEAEVPSQFHARERAYLLLKQHGQQICKSTKPNCEACPIHEHCAYFIRHNPAHARST